MATILKVLNSAVSELDRVVQVCVKDAYSMLRPSDSTARPKELPFSEFTSLKYSSGSPVCPFRESFAIFTGCLSRTRILYSGTQLASVPLYPLGRTGSLLVLDAGH